MYTSKNFQIRDEETFSLCIPTDRDYKILQLTDLHLGFGMFSGKKVFESYERREKQILAVLKEYGINSIEEAGEITKAAGLDVYAQVEGIQPICFENAKWAYTVGAAIAIKKGCKRSVQERFCASWHNFYSI